MPMFVRYRSTLLRWRSGFRCLRRRALRWVFPAIYAAPSWLASAEIKSEISALARMRRDLDLKQIEGSAGLLFTKLNAAYREKFAAIRNRVGATDEALLRVVRQENKRQQCAGR